MAPPRSCRAVTLLELLMALAIAAILAALAYPSYRQHVRRAQRTEAIEALLAVAAAQERHHLAHGRYASSLAGPGGDALPIPQVTITGLYHLTVDAPDPARYTATAVPAPGGPQAGDRRCARFTLEASGRRAAADNEDHDTTRECWR